MGGFRGTPKNPKKCTFFWVFNNSPSRDSLGPFFGPRDSAVFGIYGVSHRACRISGGRISDLWRSMSQPMSSMSQPMCVGSVIMLSLRLYVSVIANVCHTHCVGDNIIANVCRCIALVITSLRLYVTLIANVYRCHCDCMSHSLRMYIVVIALMIHNVANVYRCHCVGDTQRCNSTPCIACKHLVTDR